MENTELSPAGNWTPDSRVTGGDTQHYTIEEWLFDTNSHILIDIVIR